MYNVIVLMTIEVHTCGQIKKIIIEYIGNRFPFKGNKCHSFHGTFSCEGKSNSLLSNLEKGPLGVSETHGPFGPNQWT